jgi:thiol:disulfide interchange protein
MIPVNLAIIGAAASSGASRRVRFSLGLAYGMGMAAVYGALGAVVVRAGGVFGASLNASPLFAAVMALLCAALGLAMFGAWNLDFSRWRRAGRLAGHARFPAAFAAGGLSALLAGACVAPVLVAVLALAGNLYAAGQARALFLPFLLGVGMALPWPLAAAGFAVLPKPGAWMEVVKKVFGVLILALAAWYAWSAATRFLAARNLTPLDPGSAQTQIPATDSALPPGFVRIDFTDTDAPERLEALLAEAARKNRPVLLDFGAHWCKVCAIMDATTLRDPSVTDALADCLPVAVVADAPSAPSVAPLLARYGVHGYPAYRLLRLE